MAVADELVTLISYDLDSRSSSVLDNAKNSIADMALKVAGLSAAILTVKKVFTAWMDGLVDHSMELQRLSNDTGVSTDKIQEWGYAAQKLGGDAKTVQGDIARLAKTMSDPFSGIANEQLYKLGIAAHKSSGELKNSGELMEEIGDKLRKMPLIKAFQWGKGFVSDDVIRVMRLSKQAQSEMSAEGHRTGAIISAEDIKKGDELWKRINTIKSSVSGLALTIGSHLTPKMDELISSFEKWYKTNRDVISQGMEKIVDKITLSFEGLAAAMGLAGLASAVTLGIISAPIAGIVAGISAIVYVVKSLTDHFEGAQNVIGDMFDTFQKRYPAMADAIKLVVSIIKNLFIAVIQTSISYIETFFVVLKQTFGWLADIVDRILSTIGFGKDGVGEEGRVALDKGTNQFVDLMKKIPEFVTGTGTTEQTKSWKQGYQNYMMPQQGNSTQTVNNNYTGDVIVNGAGDARSVANEVHNKFSSIQQSTPGGYAAVIQ